MTEGRTIRVLVVDDHSVSRWILFLIILLYVTSGCMPAQVQNSEPARVVAPALPDPTTTPVVAATAAPAFVDVASPTALPPTPIPTVDPASPRGVLEAFYRWYFDQPQGVVLTNRTFFDSPQLSDIFKSDTNYLLDSFKNTSGYDPFTCAQDTLPSLSLAQMFRSGNEAHIIAEVLIDGQVRHYFVISLSISTNDSGWQIDAIRCPRQPETPVYAFYTWYLGSIFGDQDVESGAEILHNPIAEGTYRDFFLVTASFVNKIADEVDANHAAGGGVDPILNAQALPVRFSIAPGQAGPDIAARLIYDTRSVRYHTLHLVDTPPGWAVDSIEHVEVPRFDLSADADVETSDWKVHNDPSYAFSLRYPKNWFLEARSITGIPADDPLKLRKAFLAPGLDPSSPVLWLEVLEGSEAQVINAYVTENHQEDDLNGLRVWIDRETCNTRFVFRHPNRDNTWLILGDTCPGQVGCEEYAKALEGVLATLLRTISFQ